MIESSREHRAAATGLFVLLLALPALLVQVWLVHGFPSYLGARFAEDVVFALAWCALLAALARWRLLGRASWPAASGLYFLWLLLVLSEGVSYYLQADTFNDRFFGNLDPENLSTGLHAFPLQIGGGLLLLAAMLLLCGWGMRRLANSRALGWPAGAKIGTLAVLLILVLTLDSAPRRLAHYVAHYERSFKVAETPAARAVLRDLNIDPVSRKQLLAAPGRNLVVIYLESLERMYTDPQAFPGLTPNLDRLRAQGLDFAGFESYDGATYTIAGMFASQCGVPLFSSPFSAFDYAAGNNTDATIFQPKLACLGDVLHAAGYRQIYMGGAPIKFSNKGLFYKLHGYDEALGLDELEARAGNKLPNLGWGLYDADLFRLALGQYRTLEHSGKPFNLTMITLDTHPPNGRKSPDCPAYAGSGNDMLQAVHCTDFLVGRFIDQLSREPGWKDTVVMVMSDHLAMRNDSEPLYPKNYHRRPLMFVLNAGRGERTMRFYHMDVAPTLLALLGVRSNATFIAGMDRSRANAPGNPLPASDIADAILRKALWSTSSEFELCRKNTLLAFTPDGGFEIGGREMKMMNQGERAVGPTENQVLTFLIDPGNASLLLTDRDDLTDVLSARQADESALMIRPLRPHEHGEGLFSIDWLGQRGALAHVGTVPRLSGLKVKSGDCGRVARRLNAAPAGTVLDLYGHFDLTTSEPFPALSTLPPRIDFATDAFQLFRRDLGWLPISPWGSYAWGSRAALAFSLPPQQCRPALLKLDVDPYLPHSRPDLDVDVSVNRRKITTWHFKGPDSDDPAARNNVEQVSVPLSPDKNGCHVLLMMDFSRSDAKPKPWPPAEDARDLQLRVVSMSIVPAAPPQARH